MFPLGFWPLAQNVGEAGDGVLSSSFSLPSVAIVGKETFSGVLSSSFALPSVAIVATDTDHFPLTRGSSLNLWLRADLGITLVGSKVSQWNDQSGNGKNVVQATDALRPVYSASDSLVGNQASLQCTGTQYLAGLTTVNVGTQPDTVYFVCYAAAGTINIIDGLEGRQLIGLSGALWYFYAGAVVASADAGTGLSAVAAVYNGASSALYRQSSSVAIASGNPGANSSIRIETGASNGSSGLSGSLAEVVIVAGADSAQQRANMFAYFASRYGGPFT